MTLRREFATVVVVCAAGAALALFAASRPWAVEVVARPAPLADERNELTGAALVPLLPGLGWVALAGAGALIATRGRLRRGLGGLLVLAGTGLVLGAGAGAWRPETGSGWIAICALGGAGVVAAGALGLIRGHRWPAMGTRYERAGSRRASASEPEPGGPLAASAGPDGSRDRPEEIWQALDRGEDPTA